MGVMACFAELPEDRWSSVLSAVAEAGVELDDEGLERGMHVHACRRDRAEVVLLFGRMLPDGEDGVGHVVARSIPGGGTLWECGGSRGSCGRRSSTPAGGRSNEGEMRSYVHDPM